VLHQFLQRQLDATAKKEKSDVGEDDEETRAAEIELQRLTKRKEWDDNDKKLDHERFSFQWPETAGTCTCTCTSTSTSSSSSSSPKSATQTANSPAKTSTPSTPTQSITPTGMLRIIQESPTKTSAPSPIKKSKIDCKSFTIGAGTTATFVCLLGLIIKFWPKH
jgi:hypothetical protein